MRLSQPAAGANAAATSADTDEHESSCRRRWPLRLAHKQSSGLTARLKARLMQGCCGPHRSTSGLLQCTMCMHYVHHKQEGADDVSGLLIAALTASAHAIGRGVRRGALAAADLEPMAQPAASQLLWS